MNNVITYFGVQLATYANLLTAGIPNIEYIAAPYGDCVMPQIEQISDNQFSSIPYINTYDEFADNSEYVLLKFIKSIVDESTYLDQEIADYINDNIWDIL